MADNRCFIAKITHVESGKELKSGNVAGVTFIETMELDGPKMILKILDFSRDLISETKLAEGDHFTILFSEPWLEDGCLFEEKFTVLTVTQLSDSIIGVNLVDKLVYDTLKAVVYQSRFFGHCAIEKIAKSLVGDKTVKYDLDNFAIANDYHLISGERPSTLFRQILKEQGAKCWVGRNTFHFRKFAKLYKATPAYTLHHNTLKFPHPVNKYTMISETLNKTEEETHIYTGYDETKGRIKTGNVPALSGAGHVSPMMTANVNKYTLNNAPIASKDVIDLVTPGELGITAGQVLKIVWHLPYPENPIDETKPDKIVVSTVAHWYQSQTFYTRVKGAIAL